MEQSPLARGIYFDRPRDGAPSFVKGRMSIKLEDAMPMLHEHANSKGYVNFDLLQSKDGTKLYFTINTWQPKEETQQAPALVPGSPVYPDEAIRPEDVAF